MSKNKERIVVLVSLGQIVQSDLSKSVDAFTQALGGGFFDSLKVKAALLWDSSPFGPNTIDNGKKGNLTDAQFRAAINAQLGSALDDATFDRCWNAMCDTITDEVAKQLKEAEQFAKEKGIEFAVPSATNPIQFNFIKQALTDKAITLLDNAHVITSYEGAGKGQLNQKELAKIAVTDKGYDVAGTRIITLNRGYQVAVDLGVQNAGVTYVPFNTNEPEASLLNSLKQIPGIEQRSSISPSVSSSSTGVHVANVVDRRKSGEDKGAGVGVFQ
ncbi:MAG: hypothetical protein K0R63_478 [Rickettsiales bacterium]|jgi:hypothetical protein|nr:hypothetical protein [Rickettsiales bacterium]